MFQPLLSSASTGQPVYLKLVIDNCNSLNVIEDEGLLTYADFFHVPETPPKAGFISRLWQSFGLAADAFYVGAITVEAMGTLFAGQATENSSAQDCCGTVEKLHAHLAATSDQPLLGIGVNRQTLDGTRNTWLP
ncbi:hypothetical protein ELI54_34395 [Rhizobium ruizarguesonis]|jgi:hypothetical protein|uniref:hypothetical protein n=1 Tax=Rhizobium TaxID=379 RepID=UPI00102F4A64|nr:MULTISPECIES: hypothetical protein [Rhizobium]TCA20340.1 hypothetical protein E0H70_32325 [Rhizobium leguminosarum bv. viciae]NEH75642.1 hypothetical protein [Rhizobium ruizarguesonis]NEI05375.1 hypothetical protein [Rhizobium ruizarguesonis]NEI11089.1 hypothetical protein [Rhizobium ruizarguesonis]NEI59389.1 hypothetical protein [Rhizobium leguminosarum]